VIKGLSMNTVDLHTHTTASDGLFSPTELVRRAKEAGLHTIAVADHDTSDGLAEALEAGHTYGVQVIPAVEINTDVPGTEVHVLGYLPDYQQPAFQSVLTTLRDARALRGQRMVEKLNALGIPVRWERVREIAGGSVGRPHVAQALLELGVVTTIGEAFDRYIGRNGPAYVPRYKLTPEDAARFISSVRGVPVLAHPWGLPNLEGWIPRLKEAGVAGIEVYYGDYSDEVVEALAALARHFGLIATGGSDYHGPGIHPTPLGGRYVPPEAVDQLQAEAEARRQRPAPAFELPPPEEEK
jgi:predicted metal-dependent phosphoesterase TrpH